MADEYVGVPVSELEEATQVLDTDLFLIEQLKTPKKLAGKTLLKGLFDIIDGHGGIVSVEKAETVGFVDTYEMTLADGFVTTFTVTNGAKGEKGDAGSVWIKYASQKPTAATPSIGDIPDEWIGIYSGSESQAPTNWSAYTWYQWKGFAGEKGDRGSRGSAVFYTTQIVGGSPQIGLDYSMNPSYVETNGNKISVGDFIIDSAGHLFAVNFVAPDGSNVMARYLYSLIGPPGESGLSSIGGVRLYRTSADVPSILDGRVYNFLANTLITNGDAPKTGDLIVDSDYNVFEVYDFNGDYASAYWIATWQKESEKIEPILPEYFDYVILKSTESNKRFKVSVNDSGILTTERLITIGTVTFDDYSSWGAFSGTLDFEIGMTWADFCESSYNTQNFTCEEDLVLEPSGCYLQRKLSSVAYTAVKPNELIVNGRIYYWDMM